MIVRTSKHNHQHLYIDSTCLFNHKSPKISKLVNMKFLFPTVVALASFATTSMAAAIDVVDKRAVVTFPEFMNQVTTQVKQHTDALSQLAS